MRFHPDVIVQAYVVAACARLAEAAQIMRGQSGFDALPLCRRKATILARIESALDCSNAIGPMAPELGARVARLVEGLACAAIVHGFDQSSH
jgi:hypothetical protein